MNHNCFAENDKIRIAPMTDEESELYRLLRNRKDNAPFFFSSITITKEMQHKWFKKYLCDDSQLMFSIYEKSTGAFVGGVSIYDVNLQKGEAEVGRIIVDKEIASGKHYGAQSIELVSSVAKNELGLKSLYANIYSSNIASLKSFRNAGYKDEEIKDDITKVRIEL